jgi:hypothetical protein
MFFVYCLLCTYLSFTVVCALPLLIICSPLTFKQKLLVVLHSFRWPILFFNPDRFQKTTTRIEYIIDPFNYILNHKEDNK